MGSSASVPDAGTGPPPRGAMPAEPQSVYPPPSRGRTLIQRVAPQNMYQMDQMQQIGHQAYPAQNIGFRPEFLPQSQHEKYPPAQIIVPPGSISQNDTSRDLTLSRVMAADEFLGRMEETDEKIKTMVAASRDNNTDQFQPRITELLGLRGHLQDELLRIEAMLAADDPNLTCLNELADMYPRVVAKLRDINSNAQKMKAVDTGSEITVVATDASIVTEVDDIVLTTESGTQCLISGGMTTVTEMQSNTPTVEQPSSQGTPNEGQLRAKHKEEEDHVAVAFTEKLLRKREEMTQGDVDKLLTNHAIAMQALRKKQNMEKEKLKANLERKKQERLARKTKYGEGDQDEGEDMDSDDDLEDIISDFTSKSQDYSDDFEEDDDEVDEETAKQFQNKLWMQKNTLTETDFKAIVGKFRAEQDERLKVKNEEKQKHKVSLAAKLAEKKRRNGEGDEEEETSGDIPADGKQQGLCKATSSTDLFTTGDIQSIESKDSTFIDDLRKKNRHLSDDDFSELLRRHLVDVDNIRRTRMAEKARLEAKLWEKLKKNQGDKYDHSAEEAEEAERKKRSEEAEEELLKMESDFSEQLKRRRKKMDPEDIEELLKEYRERQQEVINKLCVQKTRTDALLARKLSRRRSKKNLQEEEEDRPGKDVSSLDDHFFQQLRERQLNGELSEENLAEMLQKYMNDVDNTRKKERKAQREKEREKDMAAEATRQSVNNLVQEHQEKTKQIQNLRKKERESMDEKLQRKLQEKLNKDRRSSKAATPETLTEDDMCDF